MIEIKDIEKLAALARIDIPEDEKESLRKEIDSILEYVGQVKEASAANVARDMPEIRNVLRADENPHESGIYTEELLDESPKCEGDYVKVKKILG